MLEQDMDTVKIIKENTIRIKSTERECPRCEGILVLNNNEQCYECLYCGYIDCGDDN